MSSTSTASPETVSPATAQPETAQPTTPQPATAARTERDRMREESAIARKYMGRLPWEMVAWGLGNFCFWLALWPLTFSGILPLWAAFALSTLSITLSYLPSHDAQHSIIAAEGTPLRWLNDLVGHVSIIPLVLPYRLAWITHRQHHAHANDPDRDPDYYNHGETWMRAVWNSIQGRQPGAESAYKTIDQRGDDPESRRALMEGVALNTSFYVILAVLAWSGFALEALFMWWLPRHIAMNYITLFLSWAPHYPTKETGRYRDTRAWRSPIGTVASMWMEFHIVHHLYPTIPLFQTRTAYYEMRHLLIERGCRNDGL